MIIDEKLLDEVSRQAETSPRLRMNYNFHETLDAGAQRLLNALEPGTELPVHRHRATAETYIVLRGGVKVLFYDANGQVTGTFLLNPVTKNYGIHIPKGQWHTLEVLEKGTVIFEVKDGPYTPLGKEDVLNI